MADRGTITLGLIASGPAPEQLAEALAHDLPPLLAESVSEDVAWEVPVVADPLAATPGTPATQMIDAARRRMLRDGWDLAICLTDLPLRIGRRPVVADASATHGVGLLSLPALGAVQLRRRALEAVVRLVDGLTGESLELREHGAPRRARVARRLRELATPVRRVQPDDEDVDLRFVAAVLRGNLRLLAGMLRANRPWRLVARLSRALTAAVAVTAYALVTSDVWRLSTNLGVPRLAALTVVSLTFTVGSLILAHGLWEPVGGRRGREQIVLFNVVTALTVLIGVLTLYGVLLALTFAATGLVIDDGVLARALDQPAGLRDHAEVAWMVASLATVGGALGSAVESDIAVREAAYGYRPERRTERDAG
ncbi:MAG: hypothetical protein JWQ20_3638 [Conexibacter sp.]|nr:hypothetical protein [Conexibacter sp.]